MSTSSGSYLPPSAASAAARLATAKTMQAVLVQVLQLPESLSNLKGPMQISGQVAGRGPNNVVTVNTAAGPIQLQDGGNNLRAGQNINITLHAGSPPAQADVRPQPIQTRPTQPGSIQPEAPSRPLPPQDTVTTQPKPSQPPNYGSNAAQWGQNGQYPSAKLPLDVPLRLTPLPTIPAGQTAVPLPATAQPLPALTQQAIIAQTVTQAAQQLFAATRLPVNLTAQTLSIQASILMPNALPNQQTRPPLITTTIPLSPAPLSGTPTMPQTIGLPASMAQLANLPSQQPNIGALPPLPAMAQQDVMVASILPPTLMGGTAAQLATSPAPLMAQNIRIGDVVAVVTGQTPQGQPIVQLIWPQPANGSVAQQVLNFPSANLQIGTQLILKPMPTGSMPQLVNLASTQWWKAGDWPAITQSLSTIGLQDHTSLLQQLASPARMSPSAITGAVFLFLNAMRSGDIASFLGGDDLRMKALGNSRARGPAGILEAESQRNTRLQDVDGNNWRSIALPFSEEREISMVQLYVPDRKEGDNKRQNEGQRFVMAVNLSRMGELQFDGLYTPEKSLLDLVVRSEHPFTERAQNHLNMLYAKATTRSGLTGQIFFQLKNRQWLELMPQDTVQLGTQA